MLIVVGYVAGGRRELIPTTPKWSKRLAAYLDDPIIRLANNSRLTAGYGKTVLEAASEGFSGMEDKQQIIMYQLALYAMLTRVLVLKNGARDLHMLGYSGGIHPALIATEVVDLADLPQDMFQYSMDVHTIATGNIRNGIAACAVDFTDTGWSESEVIAQAQRIAGGQIHVQDRRSPTIIDFAGPKDRMAEFLSGLNELGRMAVRTSYLRPDAGWHTKLVWPSGTPAEFSPPAWERMRGRFAQRDMAFGSTIGRMWPRTMSTDAFRDIYYDTLLVTMESGGMAKLLAEVPHEAPIFIGSRIVIQEMFAGTGYTPDMRRLIDASCL